MGVSWGCSQENRSKLSLLCQGQACIHHNLAPKIQEKGLKRKPNQLISYWCVFENTYLVSLLTLHSYATKLAASFQCDCSVSHTSFPDASSECKFNKWWIKPQHFPTPVSLEQWSQVCSRKQHLLLIFLSKTSPLKHCLAKGLHVTSHKSSQFSF